MIHASARLSGSKCDELVSALCGFVSARLEYVQRRSETELSDEMKQPPASKSVSPAYQSFLYKIATLRRLLDRYSGDELTVQSGLTLAEWRVLTVLYSSSPLTSRQLGQHLRADKAEVSRACTSLSKKEHISTTPDPSDRRSAFLAITARGRRLHDKVIPLRQALRPLR